MTRIWHCSGVDTGMAMDQRLRAAGVEDVADPVETWRRLRAVEGPAATIIDLYDLAARPRGLRARDLPVVERQALARSVLPDIWPDFGTTPGSERPREAVVIEEPDPAWPDRFEEWRVRLRATLGEAAVRIEHVGSTSVPGLTAKPILDIQVSVSDLADEDGYVAPLEAVGLQLRSRDAVHRYFRPFPGRPRDVHVHVCAAGSRWESEHLLFRDYLRGHRDARDQYAAAKRAAAAAWADDRLAYTDAKTAVILAILRRADPS